MMVGTMRMPLLISWTKSAASALCFDIDVSVGDPVLAEKALGALAVGAPGCTVNNQGWFGIIVVDHVLSIEIIVSSMNSGSTSSPSR
jgi:hypothetical protein